MKIGAFLCAVLLLSACVSREPAPVIYHGASDGISREITRILKENPKIIPKSVEPVFEDIVEQYKWIPPKKEKPKEKPPQNKVIQKQKPPVKSAAISNKFLMPVQGKIISNFGAKKDGQHNDGINIKAERGTIVKAAQSGEVVFANDNLRSYGNLILIRHDNNFMTAYAHLDQIIVKEGDRVTRGQSLGSVGSTGNVVTPQLHFEIRHGSKPINPMKFF